MPEDLNNQTPDPKNANPNPKPPEAEGEDPELERDAAFARMKNDLHEERKKRKALEDVENERKTKDLQAQNKWKEAFEEKDKEVQSLRSEVTNMKSDRLRNAKTDAIVKAASALGLRAEAISDVEAMEFKDVVVEETSTGRLIITGVKSAAEKLKTTKAHWFTDPTKPNINGKDPKIIVTEGGEITMKMVLDAQTEAKKSGDIKPYEEILRKFKAQGKK